MVRKLSPPWMQLLVAATSQAPHLALMKQLVATRSLASPTAIHVKQHALDRDVLVSVLEASATRRDAKCYLQKYAPKDLKRMNDRSRLVVYEQQHQAASHHTRDIANVAIMNLRAPQHLELDTLHGIAKTLEQLRALGLLSVVVVDCGVEQDHTTYQNQALRFCESIDSFGKPGAKLVENILVRCHHQATLSPLFWDDMRVEDPGFLDQALQHSMIAVIPSLTRKDFTSISQPVDAHKSILTLTRYFTGMQCEGLDYDCLAFLNNKKHPKMIASVERIILLDAHGGTPVPGRPGVCQRFVNIEQEYDTLLNELMGPDCSISENNQTKGIMSAHAANLKLAKETLSILPATSSALITTPSAAANNASTTSGLPTSSMCGSRFGFDGMVTTRQKHNPLLHNLLTDKPAFSSSLPYQRLQAGRSCLLSAGALEATLVKRGMPLTIHPDPRVAPWSPPKSGLPRLQLTDRCIDLPRLVNLIEDSFGRKLNLDDYLKRVNENLAGVIIAGEYEGGAILTWERPDSVNIQTAYEEEQFVPYLDKFAVLRSRQGSGGVADVVFNALVQVCFPNGVCWRSRRDNPVNKWYFERSAGTSKLSESNWTMFWTTPELNGQHQTLQNYETVCRAVLPSWEDNH